MAPDSDDLKESFMEGLAFSLLIVLLTNVFSFFLAIASEENLDSPPTPLLKEEPLASKSPRASDAGSGKQASGEELLPHPFSRNYENSTIQGCSPFNK
ncbi:MAG: hypothetical protein QW797_04355 [Thermoproteota archaeon]